MMVLLSYSLIVLLSYSPIEKDSLARHYLEVGKIKKAEEIDSKDTFLLGEVAYFNYKFEQALELYGKVSADSKDANDALSRMILIKGTDEKELQDYVNAELLGREKKFKKGIEILRKLCGENEQDNLTPTDSLFLAEQNDSLSRMTARVSPTPTEIASTIAPWASMLLIDFLQEMERQEEALKECQNFIKRFPEDDKLPQVKLEMARIYVNLGERKDAQEIYKAILLKHPMSAVTPIAREELESL
ncbi:hypothetical protein KAW50_02885 [candidate division WOR-3 bacterium]|nr:hypothetical protein [candidate division WOR-3 bacterium]